MSTNGGPATTTVSLRERQKAQTREAIIKAALEALSENRFERATHDVLAERVGCARRTVYRYFPDRDALMNAMWSYIIRDPSAAAYSLPTDEASLTETLVDFFEQMDA
ncbi:MAG: TetR/AcrR family transcriptional regulator, partial [Sphingomonadaceae bacterium]